MTQAAPAVRLLVVDDDAMARDGLQEFLCEEGFEVRVAADGVEALEVLELFLPAVLITDLEMPRLDGAGLIARVRLIGLATRILVVTGYPSLDVKRAAEVLGADAYVSKPVELEELATCVRRLLAI